MAGPSTATGTGKCRARDSIPHTGVGAVFRELWAGTEEGELARKAVAGLDGKLGVAKPL